MFAATLLVLAALVTAAPAPSPVEVAPEPRFTPPATGFVIHPGKGGNLCLEAWELKDGAAVTVNDCNGKPTQRWMLFPGETAVLLQGTEFCLDAGLTPGDGTKMKIWKCYDNHAPQTFWHTDDQRIALSGKGLCLDLTDGKTATGTPAQLWTCYDNAENQVWRTTA